MQKKNRQVLFVYNRTVSDKDSIVDRKETDTQMITEVKIQTTSDQKTQIAQIY